MSEDPRDGVTWFGATSGRVTGVLGLVVGVVVVLVGISEEAVPGALIGLLICLLSWLVLLRPRVGTRDDDLLMRGIVSTVVVPLASIETITIRQVFAVWAGGHRYVSPAVGHTLREINRQRRGAGQVEDIPVEQSRYADHVHELITERSREARRDGAPMGPVRREWAWPEIGVLAVLLVAFVVALAVS